MKILIVGGGFAGLTLANFLRQRSFNPIIIDKKSNWTQNSCALTLWPNGLKVLNKIDLNKQVFNKGIIINKYQVRNEKGKIIKEISNEELNKKNYPLLNIRHSDLHSILLSPLKNNIDIRLNTTIKKIDESHKSVTVTYNNNKKENFNLIIGADGINSHLRTLMFKEQKIHYLGAQGWCFWIPKNLYLGKIPFEIYGKANYFGYLPFTHKNSYAYLALKTPQNLKLKINQVIPYLQNKFSDIHWKLPQILHEINPEEHLSHHLYQEILLDNWHTKRSILIGDAAHAMIPTSGMGASIAIEDAFVLADEIKKNHRDIDDVFSNYMIRRFERVKSLQWQAKLSGKIMLWKSFPLRKLRNLSIKHIPEDMMHENILNFLSTEL